MTRTAVIIPCLNEAAAIASVINDFKQALPDAQIYVFDNGSTDETAAIATQHGAIVHHESRPGKGTVVRRMFADVEADVYVMVDGDDTYQASAAPTMVKKLLDESLDMVVGTRVETDKAAYRAGHRLGNKMLTGAVQRLFGSEVQDMLSGFRVFSKRFVKSFAPSSREFEIETELTVHAMQMRMPIGFVATDYKERPEGSVSKLRTYRDGVKISTMIANLMRNERPLLFFSIAAILQMILSVTLLLRATSPGLIWLGAGLGVSALLFFIGGLILDLVAHQRREQKYLTYLSFPSVTKSKSDK